LVEVHPIVYVIILNWNGWRDTLHCLAALRASSYQNLHVVVVDNGSTDDSPERLAPLLQGPRGRGELVCVGYNSGFTGGANVGLRLALERGADYALLLNNDATVEPACIATLVEAAAHRPDVGCVGPKIVWAGDPERIWSAGMSVAWRRAIVESHANEPDDGRFDDCRLVQGLSGCALLMKRVALERVGLLDERYFAYYEDLDWCLRARDAGFRCLYVGVARVAHVGSSTSKRDGGRSQPAALNYYATRNILLFLATHASRAERPLALTRQLGRLLSAVAHIIAGGLILRRPDARRRAWALIAGGIDAARGCFGPRVDRQTALRRYSMHG